MNHDKQAASLTEALAEIIRLKREKLKYSRTRLAQEAGLAFQTIAFLENAERRPTVETVTKIALVLGTTPSKLIKDAEKSCGL